MTRGGYKCAASLVRYTRPVRVDLSLKNRSDTACSISNISRIAKLTYREHVTILSPQTSSRAKEIPQVLALTAHNNLTYPDPLILDTSTSTVTPYIGYKGITDSYDSVKGQAAAKGFSAFEVIWNRAALGARPN